mmetsp:Transcript_22534/g.41957  ORF Transcript_22534/g.41957 Transcript_22534/m.41957 type:complete len:250 (+) Transcript_22534:314-1063(+)
MDVAVGSRHPPDGRHPPRNAPLRPVRAVHDRQRQRPGIQDDSGQFVRRTHRSHLVGFVPILHDAEPEHIRAASGRDTVPRPADRPRLGDVDVPRVSRPVRAERRGPPGSDRRVREGAPEGDRGGGDGRARESGRHGVRQAEASAGYFGDVRERAHSRAGRRPSGPTDGRPAAAVRYDRPRSSSGRGRRGRERSALEHVRVPEHVRELGRLGQDGRVQRGEARRVRGGSVVRLAEAEQAQLAADAGPGVH